MPDGLTVDSEGCLWIALWEGSAVVRYDAQGKHIDTIEMPVPRPTSVMFGGEDLSTLYITSARYMMEADELAQYPLSGSLFAVETNPTGLLQNKFAGHR